MGSEPRRGLDLPTAVLLGSAIIAFGVYRGLAAHGPAVVPSVLPAGPASAPPPPATTPPSPALPPAVLAADRQVAIDERARMAIEKRRPALLEACWKPFVADGGPRQSLYKVELWFDATGKETRRDAFLVPDAESRPDALKCLRSWELGKLTITPPAPLAGQQAGEMKATLELPFP